MAKSEIVALRTEAVDVEYDEKADVLYRARSKTQSRHNKKQLKITKSNPKSPIFIHKPQWTLRAKRGRATQITRQQLLTKLF